MARAREQQGRNRAAAGRRRARAGRPQLASAPARPTQREVLLDEAARQFNARGIAATAVNQVAKRVGLTRAAVYYYVKDSEDLVFQCYLRACQLTADDLAHAHEDGKDDVGRISAFVRRALAPERPQAAVVSEIAYLSDAKRTVVEAEHGRNIAALESFVRSGIRAGTIRECDAHVVAQAIFGIVSWIVLSPGWVGKGGDAAFALRMADAVVDHLEHGLARSPAPPFSCRIDVKSLVSSPANMFDREHAAAMKVDQLLETASRLFNERGLDGASLDQIAAALGATKGALYHYFSDKRELILSCYERSAALDEKMTDLAERSGSTGHERGMIGLHLNVQAQVAGPSPLVPLIGFESIAPGPRKALQKRLAQLHWRFTEMGRQGIADGSNRQCDVDAIALAGAGIFGWIPKWLPASAAERRWEIADQMVELSRLGLRPR
ncbi:MAG TPA: TetR family transcriptional regulator [Steroidobacteraceae bacterium]|nr:TetR family transcriptional regulator [Steroidobacteraceae bacterium]